MAEKAKVKVVLISEKPDIPTWPYVNYNYEKRAEEIMEVLKGNLPGIEFSKSLLSLQKEVESVIEDKYDGYLVYMTGSMWSGIPEVVMRSGYPVVLADDLYAGSGGFLKAYSWAKKEKLPVIGVASANSRDIIDAVKLFEVIKKMKESRILVIQDTLNRKTANKIEEIFGIDPDKMKEIFGTTEFGKITDKMKETFGTEVLRMSSQELNSYCEKIDENKAKKWKDKWIKEALKVVEPTEEEILKSARMYLALKTIMEERGINAVTVDCLGLCYMNKLIAYPCLAFFQLNNDGSTGVCEADLDSTITQLIMRYLTGRPGYVSDPVIDTSSNQIIYAHCVATNKVYGPKGLANPYLIRSHNEDRKGASIQSLMPLGEKVTTAKINIAEKSLAIHQGKAIANVEEDKACRTKLATEVKAGEILNNWNAKFNFGWHRVTFYGDWKKELINLATLLKLEVFEEDK